MSLRTTHERLWSSLFSSNQSISEKITVLTERLRDVEHKKAESIEYLNLIKENSGAELTFHTFTLLEAKIHCELGELYLNLFNSTNKNIDLESSQQFFIKAKELFAQVNEKAPPMLNAKLNSIELQLNSPRSFTEITNISIMDERDVGPDNTEINEPFKKIGI